MCTFNSVEDSFDDCDQFVGLKRFCQVSIYTCAKPLDTVCRFIPGSKKHNRHQRCSRGATQLTRQLISIHPGHANVTHYQVRYGLRQLHKGFPTTASGAHIISFSFETSSHRSEEVWLVINY
jgi:hypothetical protein